MKIILNRCYGGYDVSKTAILLCREVAAEWACWPNTVLPGEYGDVTESWKELFPTIHKIDQSRVCPHLIQLVENDPDMASGDCAKLKVVEIDEDERYEILDYDGMEKVSISRE